MELPDNVIRHYLRDVYFISGSACGGKSTISQYLSAKHGITLYDWDKKYGEHKAISDATHQPYMNRTYGSWEECFSRPPREYSESLRRSICEQAEMAIVELLSIAANGRVIVDGMFPCHVLKRISNPDRAVFLMATMDAIRSDFFDRAYKEGMLRCVNGLHDPQQAMENVFQSIEHSLSRDMEAVRASGFRWFLRDQRPDWDSIRLAVEQHLRLTGRRDPATA